MDNTTPTPVSKLEELVNSFGLECYGLGRKGDWVFKATDARQAILDHVKELVASASSIQAEIVMTPVKSSNIKSIGYSATDQTLQVEFTNGTLYAYADVPHYVYDSFMKADSKGAFFATEIRNGYATVKLK